MSFVLKNAPHTLQKPMTEIFGDLDFVIVYLDDILIFLRDLALHETHVKTVLVRAQEAGISINLEKSKFGLQEIKYLDHYVSEKGTRPDTTRAQKLMDKQPRTKREVMKSLGDIQWYRNFLPNASQKTEFLTKLLKKGKQFEWDNEHETALQKLVKEIQETTLLSHPEFDKTFVLSTDASNTGMGATLTQNEKLIGYYSKRFTPTEERYSVVERETYAIVKSVLHFHTILFGSELTILCDNKNSTL